MPSPLISVADLERQLHHTHRPPALLDVRWELATGAQRGGYEAGHIPGAAFVDLDRDLSGPPGQGGRHPLPAPHNFTTAMRAAGVWSDRPVIVYDAATSLAAARAWWLLRYFGHPEVAVLDGGLMAWTDAGQPLAGGTESPAPGDYEAHPGAMPVLDAAGAGALAQSGGLLLDARAPERFRGETEPLDAVAGHIPGARNRPTTLNLDAAGRFLPPAELGEAFTRLGAGPALPVGAYCGSGVTAAHEVLALELAGISAALYPGSWSEWITDPRRPVATGPAGDAPH
jgi:thiosulfate/3-mercaptopyruvate sulfurtransferase